MFIERLNYEDSIYAGSIKRLNPEQNPYRALSRYDPTTVFNGTVLLIHENGVTVELLEGCIGELPRLPETAILAEGSKVNVQITSLEADDEAVTLKLAGVPDAPR